MPAEDGVGREQAADFGEQFATQNLAFHGQAAALVIVEQDTFLADLFLEDLVFGAQVVDQFLLLVVDPACEDGQQKLPGGWIRKFMAKGNAV